MAARRKTKEPDPPKARPSVGSKKGASRAATSSGKTAAITSSGSSRPAANKSAASGKKEVDKGAVGPGNNMKKNMKKEEPQKDRLSELKNTLLKKREEIVREAKEEIAKYVSGDARQLVDTAVDEGDWATVDISEDVNLMRLDAHRKLLINIDEALRKIREGTYGICEDCGEEISEKRLGVMPTATLCISCQENKEQMEAISREETE